MTWLRDNTPLDAIILAADGDAWLPVIAERRAIHYRALRYFEWDEMPKASAIASNTAVDYVYVPADMEPPADSPLIPIFEADGVRVYRITDQ
jgi:hypothetical protein